ncbi:faciogenital dysplasia protein [Anaeramoeba flamelloides]|uniref:Faciogenital dysplasia protein n=1 Tax=Anaeramoeba flamelloides TaxID=1746091 RepID=A0ABQ8ZB84_9EUKA|nr:faciogenital dysplasia protein [Anaeramoeba flamelloides]
MDEPKLNKNKATIAIQRVFRGFSVRKMLSKKPEISKKLTKQHFLLEIVDTEQTYFKILNALVFEYIYPLRDCDFLEESVLIGIFSNIEMLYHFHSKFAQDLLERYQSDLFLFADLFQEFVPYLILYSSFVNNFDHSHQVLVQEKSKNKKFSNFLKETKSKSTIKQDIHSLLITPIQRIPRYVMLVEGLLKHLETNHYDYKPFQIVLSKLQDLAINVNKKKYENEIVGPLLYLEKKFENLGGATLIKGGRQLLKEGHLIETSHPEPSKSWIFLFSDCIIFATNHGEKYQKRFAIPISQITIDEKKDIKVKRSNQSGLNFEIKTEKTTYIFRPESKKDKEEWVHLISKTINELQGQINLSFDQVKWSKIEYTKNELEPTALHGHKSSLIGNEMYVFGGEDSEGNVQNTLYTFNIETNSWEIVEAVQGKSPSPRSEMSMNAISTYIFIFGGTNQSGRLGDLHLYLTEEKEWINYPETHGNPPTPRSGHAADVIENQLWIYGGRDESGQELGDLYCLDCNTYTWFHVEPEGNLLPSPRVWHTLTFVESQIVIFGGWSLGRAINDVWIYDLVTSKWYEADIKGDELTPRFGHSACYVPFLHRIYYIGGKSTMKFYNNIGCLHFASASWQKISEDGDFSKSRTQASTCYFLKEKLHNRGQNKQKISQNSSDIENKSTKSNNFKNTIILFGGYGQREYSNLVYYLDLDWVKSGKRLIEEEVKDLLYYNSYDEKVENQEDIDDNNNDNDNGTGNGNDNDDGNGNDNFIEIEIEKNSEDDLDFILDEDYTNDVIIENIERSQPNGEINKVNVNKNNHMINELFDDDITKNKYTFIGGELGKTFLNQIKNEIKKTSHFGNETQIQVNEFKKQQQQQQQQRQQPQQQQQQKQQQSNNINKNNNIVNIQKLNTSNKITSQSIKNSKLTTRLKYLTDITLKRKSWNIHDIQNSDFKISKSYNTLEKGHNQVKSVDNLKNYDYNGLNIILKEQKKNNEIEVLNEKENQISLNLSEIENINDPEILNQKITELKQKCRNVNAETLEIRTNLQILKDKLQRLQNSLNRFELCSEVNQRTPLKFYRKNNIIKVMRINDNTSFFGIKKLLENTWKREITICNFYSKNKIENHENFRKVVSRFDKVKRNPIKFKVTFGKKIK